VIAAAFHWLALLFWLGLSFFMSGMEAGVMALNRLRIRQWMREGKPQAPVLLEYLEHPENFLWTILVGNTLANLSAVVLIVSDLHSAVGDTPWLFWICFIAVIGLIYVIGELLPKTLFRMFPNRLCLKLVGVYRLVHLALSPMVRMIESFATLLLRLTGGQALSANLFGNREEFRALMQDSGSTLRPEERTLIMRVLDLQTRTVGDVITPIDRADTVSASTPLPALLELCRRNQHTRVPVWSEGPMARRVVGVVSLKNILYTQPDPNRRTAGDFLRPALFLDASMRLEDALQRLQRSGEHLAIVVDSNRKEIGLVTLADMLRVLFGKVTL
jgi:CBS domain containing-hemolysin-like protein